MHERVWAWLINHSESEGVRRAICDMTLLIFHLVLSSYTFEGVDVMMARKIVEWNLERYPNGISSVFVHAWGVAERFQASFFYLAPVALRLHVHSLSGLLNTMLEQRKRKLNTVIYTTSAGGRVLLPIWHCGTSMLVNIGGSDYVTRLRQV